MIHRRRCKRLESTCCFRTVLLYLAGHRTTERGVFESTLAMHESPINLPKAVILTGCVGNGRRTPVTWPLLPVGAPWRSVAFSSLPRQPLQFRFIKLHQSQRPRVMSSKQGVRPEGIDVAVWRLDHPQTTAGLC